MQIYISHSTTFDYQKDLYSTLNKSKGFKIYFPHENEIDAIDTRKIIEASDLIFAEVSYPSTGQGFELAWACDANIPIICVHKENAKISSTLNLFCPKIYSYADEHELLAIFEKLGEHSDSVGERTTITI